MQVQDFLPFFQDLWRHYYEFTLENAVYAVCLAVSVWLLTAIIYSIRIGFLNRRNRISLKACLDAQNGQAAAQQQIQQLQEEIAANKQQAEQEAQRSAVLQERMSELGRELAGSIVALAAEPDLGQQGLSVKEGLEAEQLWQSYSAAVKQLCESLIAERKATAELQQAFSAETARLADKNLQLQAMQIRFDSQTQQLVELESTIDEHKTQLARQEERSQQRLTEIEAKHRADLERLAVLEAQELDRAQVQQRQPQEKPKTQDEPLKPVQAQPAVVELWSRQVKAGSEPAASEVAMPEPVAAIAETPNQPLLKTVEEAGGITGKFKSLFAGGKQKKDVRDEAPVQNEPLPQADQPIREPRTVVAEERVSQADASVRERQIENEVKESLGGLSDKFKNLFGASREPSTGTVSAVDEKPAETNPGGAEQQPAVAAAGKFKSLIAGAMQKFEKLDEMLGQNTPLSPAEEPSRTVLTSESRVGRIEASSSERQAENEATESFAGLTGKFKSLFGSSNASPSVGEAVQVEPEQQPAADAGSRLPGQIKNLFGKFKL